MAVSWFADILGNWKTEKTDEYLSFGRFSDAYKKKEKYEQWDQAVDLFRAGDTISSYLAFLDYLDHGQGNVSYSQDGDNLQFTIIQGSKKITGKVGEDYVRAECKVAQMVQSELGYMRFLAEKNYELKYSRYSLDENDCVCLVFDSFLLDCSPFKLYYALKEVALSADKLDDILVEEFKKGLTPVDTDHILELSDDLKAAKRSYLRSTLEDTLEYYNRHESDGAQSPGGLSYLLLAAGYKIDYLTQPEAYTLEAVERIQRLYYSRDDLDMLAKNQQIVAEYRRILQRDDALIEREFYHSIFTFGITKPIGTYRLTEIFAQDWKNLLWYSKHNLPTVAIAIADYIVGYSLFNFAPAQPIRELLHLYYEIMESSYLVATHDASNFWKDGEINQRLVRRELKAIEDRYEDQIVGFALDERDVDCSSRVAFVRSFLIMIDMIKIG